MRGVYIFLIVIVFIIVTGLIIGYILPTGSVGCTKKNCSCQGIFGEMPCNDCSYSDYIFATGLVNLIKKCKSSQIVTCENDIQVNSRIDSTNEECDINWNFFEFAIQIVEENPKQILVIE